MNIYIYIYTYITVLYLDLPAVLPGRDTVDGQSPAVYTSGTYTSQRTLIEELHWRFFLISFEFVSKYFCWSRVQNPCKVERQLN